MITFQWREEKSQSCSPLKTDIQSEAGNSGSALQRPIVGQQGFGRAQPSGARAFHTGSAATPSAVFTALQVLRTSQRTLYCLHNANPEGFKLRIRTCETATTCKFFSPPLLEEFFCTCIVGVYFPTILSPSSVH